jgi:hypothetical protein
MGLLDYQKFLLNESMLFEARTDYNMKAIDAANLVVNPNLKELLNWAGQNTPNETFLVDSIRAKEGQFDKKQLAIKANYDSNIKPFIDYAKTKDYFKILKTSAAPVESNDGWITFEVATPENGKPDIVKIETSRKVAGKREVKTDVQEAASLIVFENFIEKGVTTIADILNDIKKVWPDIEDYPDWMESLQLQGSALKAYLGSNRGYSYYRIDGFPKAVYDFVKKLGVTQKDSWDPADVWLVKNTPTHEKALAEIVETDQSLVHVNDYLRSHLKEKEIIPISLKKAKNNISVSEVNVEETFQAESVMVSGIQCDLEPDTKNKKTTKFILAGARMDLNSGVVFYARMTSGAFIVEAAQKGAAAQLGKVPSMITQRVTGEKRLVVSYWMNKFDPDGDLGTLFDTLQSSSIVDTKCTLPKEAFLKIMEDLFNEGGNSRKEVYAQKCLAMVWTASLAKMNDETRNKAAATLYYGAQKSGADFGPFIKIY